MKDLLKKHIEIVISAVIFLVVLLTHYDFYKVIILLLEFIVIVEVVKMISEFISNKKLQLRYVIDVFIIFLTREVIILSSHRIKDYTDIVFLLFVISVFFMFRLLTLKYSPARFLQKDEE